MENMEGIVEELVVAENRETDDLDEAIEQNILQVTLEHSELEGEEASDNEVNETHQEELTEFTESSSEDEEVKNADVYVNVVGKRITEMDLLHGQEMKQSMKEFFMKCAPDVSFSTLVQFFVQRLPQPKPVFVLASDICPKDLDPNRRYAIVCAVSDCENAYIRDGNDWENIEQTKNFFGFPLNEDQCRLWISSINRLKYLERSSEEIQNYRVCEDHFTPEDFTSEYKDELTETAVPSLLLLQNQDSMLEESE